MVGRIHGDLPPLADDFKLRLAGLSNNTTILRLAMLGVRQHLAGCRALVIESNHDPRMLVDGPYPWELKQRIKGDKGHLSNAQCAEALAGAWHPGLRRVVLAHLSEKNNTPRLALAAARTALPEGGRHVRIDAAEQSRPLVIRIETDRPEETA